MSTLPESQTMESESLAKVVARLRRDVAGVQRDLAEIKTRLPKRPTAGGRLRTRPDRTPYGWRCRSGSTKLVPEKSEQMTISLLLEACRDENLSLRDLGKFLDSYGRKRRTGGSWAKAPGLIRAILLRCGVQTAEDAEKVLAERIAATQGRAAVD